MTFVEYPGDYVFGPGLGGGGRGRREITRNESQNKPNTRSRRKNHTQKHIHDTQIRTEGKQTEDTAPATTMATIMTMIRASVWELK